MIFRKGIFHIGIVREFGIGIKSGLLLGRRLALKVNGISSEILKSMD
jgi:hypothetical protein